LIAAFDFEFKNGDGPAAAPVLKDFHDSFAKPLSMRYIM
jgi:hypothetical protein